MKDNGKSLTYDLTYKEVVDILTIINESTTCKEFHLQLGELNLTIVRELNESSKDVTVNATIPEIAKAPPTHETIQEVTREVKEVSDKNGDSKNFSGIAIKSPMLGTVYLAPAPDEPPFVKVGSKVKEDDIIGIIDVMKLMNTIRAGCDGIINEICVRNEEMVEYNQVLMVVEPVKD